MAGNKTAGRRTRATASSSTERRRAVTIRHYCQGLGDCHLLSFPKTDGGTYRVLIDCGVHTKVKGGRNTIKAIVEDIRNEVGDEGVDVLVVTHEHWDHVSGFSTAKEAFDGLAIGQVWLPWTENPDDPMARELDRYRGQALAALGAAADRMAASSSPFLVRMHERLDTVLGFSFGAEGDLVRGARDRAVSMSSSPARYLEPGTTSSLDGTGVRVRVLGPPRSAQLLRLEESSHEMYRHGHAAWSPETALSAGLGLALDGRNTSLSNSMPFQDGHGEVLQDVLHGRGDPALVKFLKDHYVAGDHAEDEWRRIDGDWLSVATELALMLDRGINNTSLVLAFEVGDDRSVLLFPGDAQIGNWKSWDDVDWGTDPTTAADLLARTVYLKVAHHGSHNATPHRLGLERMTNPSLAAFIPVNKADAMKAGWEEMPFEPIVQRLLERTGGRTIQADDKWIGKSPPPFMLPTGCIADVRSGALWVEVELGEQPAV